MFKVMYAIRHKKNQTLLNVEFTDNSFMDDDYLHENQLFELETYSNKGVWMTDKLQNALFVMQGVSGDSENYPAMNINRDYVEVVSIVQFKEIQIVTSENTPQSLTEFFESEEHLINSVATNIHSKKIEEDVLANIKNRSIGLERPCLSAYDLERAWLILTDGKDIVKKPTVEWFMQKITKEMENIEK